jgi:hypothetical protein
VSLQSLFKPDSDGEQPLIETPSSSGKDIANIEGSSSRRKRRVMKQFTPNPSRNPWYETLDYDLTQRTRMEVYFYRHSTDRKRRQTGAKGRFILSMPPELRAQIVGDPRRNPTRDMEEQGLLGDELKSLLERIFFQNFAERLFSVTGRTSNSRYTKNRVKKQVEGDLTQAEKDIIVYDSQDAKDALLGRIAPRYAAVRTGERSKARGSLLRRRNIRADMSARLQIQSPSWVKSIPQKKAKLLREVAQLVYARTSRAGRGLLKDVGPEIREEAYQLAVVGEKEKAADLLKEAYERI